MHSKYYIEKYQYIIVSYSKFLIERLFYTIKKGGYSPQYFSSYSTFLASVYPAQVFMSFEMVFRVDFRESRSAASYT